MRHVCFGDDGRNTVKGQARCRVIAQQMSAYNLLQYGQCQHQHRQQFGCYGSARIVLLLADGATITDIAATVGISRRFVYKWVKRFLQEGLEGLQDKPGPGRRFEPLPPYLRDQPHNMDVG